MEAHPQAGLLQVLSHATWHGLAIGLFVFLMMMVVDYLNVLSRGRLGALLRGGSNRQVVTASLLGALPGCLGAFLVVTLYMRGLVGLGATVGCFLASSGDAAFVMLSLFPGTALALTGVMLVLGIAFGIFSEWFSRRLGLEPCPGCRYAVRHLDEPDCRTWPGGGLAANFRSRQPLRLVLVVGLLAAAGVVIQGWLGPPVWNWQRVAILVLLAAGLFVVVTVPDHYLVEHVGHHILARHLPGVLAWTIGTLWVLGLANHYFDLGSLVSEYPALLILLAGLVGLLPDSGPHLIFVFLYAQGAAPLSVLLTSSLVQDGHGLLPLLAISVRDALVVKLFNLAIGLAAGYAALAVGL